MTFLLSTSMCLLATSLFYVNDPVVNMRETPSDTDRVASQAVFSENVQVEKESGDWLSIKTPDGYSGWIHTKSVVGLDKPYEATLKITRLSAHVYGVKDTEWGPIITLPYGAKLKLLEDSDTRWLTISLPDGRQGYIQRGDVEHEPDLNTKEELVTFSQKFLGLPYTWGGRSGFGYDCSGFIQMLYGRIGINLERDARQQIRDPRFKEIDIDALEPGDLLFFGKNSQKINHVGMYLGHGQFIHAIAIRENKPWIRISALTDFQWNGQSEAYYPYRTARQLVKVTK